jgi:hypothetical protein
MGGKAKILLVDCLRLLVLFLSKAKIEVDCLSRFWYDKNQQILCVG